jgi:hypothetical protein
MYTQSALEGGSVNFLFWSLLSRFPKSHAPPSFVALLCSARLDEQRVYSSVPHDAQRLYWRAAHSRAHGPVRVSEVPNPRSVLQNALPLTRELHERAHGVGLDGVPVLDNEPAGLLQPSRGACRGGVALFAPVVFSVARSRSSSVQATPAASRHTHTPRTALCVASS